MTLQTKDTTAAITTIDLDFMLSHFEEPIWPRPVSTHATQNRQVEVNSRQAGLNLFEYAKSLDCKIRAFPSYVEWKGLNRQPPNLIFIDLDLLRFKSKPGLDRALHNTLQNIKEKLDNAQPTVLWSGGGYHIIMPTKAFLLEDYGVFADNFKQPSRKFLQFAEQYFTNKKADPCHTLTMSFKNCMLRVPGSYNSKYVQIDDKHEIVNRSPEAEVKIIQQWDGKRPAINWLLRDFRRYLIQDKYDKTRKHFHPPKEFCTYWRSSKCDR